MESAITRSNSVANLIQPLVDGGNIDAIPDRIKNQAQTLFGAKDLNLFRSLVGELKSILLGLCQREDS